MDSYYCYYDCYYYCYYYIYRLARGLNMFVLLFSTLCGMMIPNDLCFLGVLAHKPALIKGLGQSQMDFHSGFYQHQEGQAMVLQGK